MKKLLIISAFTVTLILSGCASESAASSGSETIITTAVTTTTASKTEPVTTAPSHTVESDVAAVTLQSTSTEKDILDNSLGLLSSTADIALRDIDGKGSNYEFDYDGEVYSAIYTPDNWKIVDSYKISNSADMKIICQSLIDVHPVHGRDMASYREARDMVEEWLQHNLAYELFSDNAALKARAKDVDLNPEDQGRNIIEKYMEIADLF